MVSVSKQKIRAFLCADFSTIYQGSKTASIQIAIFRSGTILFESEQQKIKSFICKEESLPIIFRKRVKKLFAPKKRRSFFSEQLIFTLVLCKSAVRFSCNKNRCKMSKISECILTGNYLPTRPNASQINLFAKKIHVNGDLFFGR